MKKFSSIMCSIILLFPSILLTGCTAELKSKPEADQVVQIRQFFKDKEPVPWKYEHVIKKGDAQFREQLLKGWSISDDHTKRNIKMTREVDEKFYKEFAKRVRGFEGEKEYKIYTLSDGVPKIGVGFCLIMKISKGKWKAYDQDFLKSLGIPLNADEYKIIEQYADLKSRDEPPSDELYSALKNIKVHINAQIEENLLRYAVEEKYEIIKRAIGKDTWDQLGFARKIGIMDFCYQYGHITPLIVHIKAGDFKQAADVMRAYGEMAYGEVDAYLEGITEEQIQFREQLLKDFTTQTGIEHVQPIAVGKSIDDPQIAKFNTACPNKKPMNSYREWLALGARKQYYPPEEILEDSTDEYANSIAQYKCTGNLKVYRFNVYNTEDNKKDYVLYCDDFINTRAFGKFVDEKKKKESYQVEGAYLTFDPNECLYPKRLDRFHSQLKDFMTGIFKYKGKYYFYTIKTRESFKFEGKEETNLSIWREGTNDYGHSFGKSYIMKGILK